MTRSQFEEVIVRCRENGETEVNIRNEIFTEEINIFDDYKFHFSRCSFTTLRSYQSQSYSPNKLYLINCSVDTMVIPVGQEVIISNSSEVLQLYVEGRCKIKNSSVSLLTQGDEPNDLFVECMACSIGKVQLNYGTCSLTFKVYGGSIAEQLVVAGQGTCNLTLGKGTRLGCSVEIFSGNSVVLELSNVVFSGTPDQSLILSYRRLSNTTFMSIDMSKILLLFDDVVDYSFDYHDVVFPSALENYKKHKDDWVSLQTMFRKLKQNFEARNDHILARIFAAMELESYYRYVTETKGDSLLHHFPLFVSKLTNDFGRSWLRPASWLLGLSVFSYGICFLTILNNYPWVLIPHVGADMFNKGLFFEYLFPVHSFEIFEEYKTGWLVHLTDALQRIVSGFLVFQLIRAFRFHVAK